MCAITYAYDLEGEINFTGEGNVVLYNDFYIWWFIYKLAATPLEASSGTLNLFKSVRYIAMLI